MVLNTLGAVLVVGGGVLSFVLDRRRHYALLIAAGALANAIGGILLGILGIPDLFFYFEFLGIILLFLGFLLSSRFVSRTRAPSEAMQGLQTRSQADVRWMVQPKREARSPASR